MTFRFFAMLGIMLLIGGCGGGRKLSQYYTAEDRAVFELIEQVKKSPSDKATIRLLDDAYEAAFQKRVRNAAALPGNNMPENEADQLITEWEIVNKMYGEINALGLAPKLKPDLSDPGPRVQQLKEQTAEQYYLTGRTYLGYNTREQAQRALEYFEKANKLVPGYKDVNRLIQDATERSLTRVLVNPVNYNRYGFSYWGFQNDWLQQQMVRDLNTRAYRNVRFYSEQELRAAQLVPDKIVDLDFVELFVDRVHADRRQYNRAKNIQTGETKTKPPRPVYTTVRATVYVERQYMSSYATLECRIYDQTTNQNVLYDRFPDRINWTQERARYTGDRRALEPSDIALLSNRWDDYPPTREQIADRLIRSTYQQLLSRISSGVNF